MTRSSSAAPDRSVEVAVLESTLSYCVVFHDHFPQTGQHPVLILASYHVHSDLYEGGAGEDAASFLVQLQTFSSRGPMWQPGPSRRPFIHLQPKRNNFHPPATQKMIYLTQYSIDLPAACLVTIGHHHQHVPSLERFA